jgi:hypothetical protein
MPFSFFFFKFPAGEKTVLRGDWVWAVGGWL